MNVFLSILLRRKMRFILTIKLKLCFQRYKSFTGRFKVLFAYSFVLTKML